MYSYLDFVLFLRGDPIYEKPCYILALDFGGFLLGEDPADPTPPPVGRIDTDIPVIVVPTVNYFVLALRPNPEEFFVTFVAAVVDRGFELICFFLLGAKAT